jgi:D-tyrosyl-tRNA(Tyr) deacylase
MKALIQRVSEASVDEDGRRGRNRSGLLVLLGMTHSDGMDDAAWLARKIPALRIFEDRRVDEPSCSTSAARFSCLAFTLYADTRKRHPPSFVAARVRTGRTALRRLCATCANTLGASRVSTGVFGRGDESAPAQRRAGHGRAAQRG